MSRVKRTESGGYLLPLANAEIDWLRFDGGGVELSFNSDFAKLINGFHSLAVECCALRLRNLAISIWTSMMGEGFESSTIQTTRPGSLRTMPEQPSSVGRPGSASPGGTMIDASCDRSPIVNFGRFRGPIRNS